MAHISWLKEYSVGVELLDEQHRHFLRLLDEVYDAIISLETHKHIGDIIGRIAEHVAVHFATEEGYFDRFNYERAEEHRERHRELERIVADLQARYAAGEMSIENETLEFMEGWLIGHIMEDDKRYMRCFAEHGLGTVGTSATEVSAEQQTG